MATADGEDPQDAPPAPPAHGPGSLFARDDQATAGPPIFVNPDHLAPPSGQAAPTFVRADGTPVEPAAPYGGHPYGAAPQAGGPTFVKPGGQPVGAPVPTYAQAGQPGPPTYAPTYAQAGQPGPPTYAQPPAPGQPTFVQASQATAPGYTVAGGQPGGPVFVKADVEDISLADDRPWRWWVGPVAVFVAFAVVLFLAVFLTIAIEAGGGNAETAFDENTHWLGLAQDLLWVAVALLVPFMAARRLAPEDLGLKRQPFWRSVGVLAACMFGFCLLAGAYGAALGLDENSNDLLKDTGFGDSVGRDILLALLFVVAAPVAEELLFRGLLFRSLRDGFMAKVGRKSAIGLGALISGVIFGGIHVGGGQDKYLPVLMLLGVLLALAYQWSGTLYVPVTIHAINNAAATGFNADPESDWIYLLIGLGPLLAIATYWLLTRFIRGVFPQERADPPEPPAPPVLPNGFAPSGTPANL